eukprot:14398823-Alexandrium_andersonii.AAC.1
MQARDVGNPIRQQALIMTMWPQAGRGAAPLPPRTLLHHPAEEPVSIQVVAQVNAGVEIEAAVERAVRQLQREGWTPTLSTD